MSGGRNQRCSRNGGHGWNERDEIGNLSRVLKGFGKVLGKCPGRFFHGVVGGSFREGSKCKHLLLAVHVEGPRYVPHSTHKLVKSIGEFSWKVPPWGRWGKV